LQKTGINLCSPWPQTASLTQQHSGTGQRESRERVFHSRPAIYILLFLSAGKKLRLGRLEFPYWDGHAKYANQSHAVYTPGLSKPNKRQQLLFNLRRSRYFFSARAAISCWLIKRIYSRHRACFFGNNWTRERRSLEAKRKLVAAGVPLNRRGLR
jgi:hypothetical protein